MAKRKITSNNIEDAVVLKKASSGYDNITQINDEIVEVKDNNEKKCNVIDFPKDGAKEDLDKIKIVVEEKRFDKDDYKRLKFIMKALNFNDLKREYTKIVKIERNSDDYTIAISTDGYRIHYAQLNIKIPEGNYYINKEKNGNTNSIVLTYVPKDKFDKFPNWRKIADIDQKESSVEVNFRSTGLNKDIDACAKMTRSLYAILKKIDKLINLRFLDDLEKESHYIYYDKEKNSGPVKFNLNSNKELAAYIMPMEPEI
jgi:hypothetical protein